MSLHTSLEEKDDHEPQCNSPSTLSEGESISPDLPTMKMETVGINLANCSSFVCGAHCNIPGVKFVNELAEKEWTSVVKKKGGMRQLDKGEGTIGSTLLLQAIRS